MDLSGKKIQYKKIQTEKIVISKKNKKISKFIATMPAEQLAQKDLQN